MSSNSEDFILPMKKTKINSKVKKYDTPQVNLQFQDNKYIKQMFTQLIKMY